MDSSVIDQNVVHLEVSVFARFLLLELDERVLQRVAARLVPDDFASLDFPESTENNLKIVVGCDGIQFAHEENILRWSDVSVWNVADNLQDRCSSLRFSLLQHFVDFRISLAMRIVDVLVRGDSSILHPLS